MSVKPTAPLLRRAPRVLVVDEDKEIRCDLRRALTRAGYSVLEAETGTNALRMARRRPDLIALDVNLPDISGVEVCRRIKGDPSLRAIPVIHLSATFALGRGQAAALNSGADGYLSHPVEEAVLVATVGACIRARRAEGEREESLAQARQAVERLSLERELRERFVATLTHDLQTPLTAAKISAQMALRQPGLPEKARKMVSRVKDCIDRSEGMVRDLLDVNRIRAGAGLALELREARLKEIVQLTLDTLVSIHGDRLPFCAIAEGRGLWDATQIRRAIENLVGNAAKYGAACRPITITLEEAAAGVELAVHNEGPALTAEERASLFEPYRRAHSAEESGQRGWGLGLTLVRAVVEAHGGKIWVNSSGFGTEFRMRFPRSPADRDRASASPAFGSKLSNLLRKVRGETGFQDRSATERPFSTSPHAGVGNAANA